jgi:hypothetical protein
MSQYTPEILREHLGDKYDPTAEYLVETHRGAAVRCATEELTPVGTVPDFSTNEKGTMVVLVKPRQTEPEPSDVSEEEPEDVN